MGRAGKAAGRIAGSLRTASVAMLDQADWQMTMVTSFPSPEDKRDVPMYKCGYAQGIALDPARLSWDASGPRPCFWSIWYPSEDAGSTRHVRDCSEDIFDLGSVQPGLRPLAKPMAPVVLLSHGTGGTAESLGWIARKLAERGSLVIAANHHGNTGLEDYRPEGFLCWWERAADLSLLLTHFAGHARFEHLVRDVPAVTVGYSLGAHTSLSLLGAETSMAQFREWAQNNPFAANGPREFPDLTDHIDRLFANSEVFRHSWAQHGQSFRDERISSGILLAPPPPVRALTPRSLAGISTPLTILAAANDTEANPDLCARWLCKQNPDFELTVLPDADHYAFLGPLTEKGATILSGLFAGGPSDERERLHADVGDAILEQIERLKHLGTSQFPA